MTAKRRANRVMKLLLFSIPLIGVIAWAVSSQKIVTSSPISEAKPSRSGVSEPQTLEDLLTLPDNARQTCDLALVNLLCAQGLPGAEGLDPDSCSTTLDEWAQRVRSETDRHLYRFQSRPDEYENSEGYFRMLMMAVVLHEDFGVRYNPERAGSPAETSARDGFFADSRDVFVHGLLSSRRMGTCSSIPVLYAAIGRRLGYPLKLVTTKGHLFVRWEGTRERFNVEASDKGLNRFDDDYYKTWPFPVTEEEIQAEGYLQSLAPAGELAVFSPHSGSRTGRPFVPAFICPKKSPRPGRCRSAGQPETERFGMNSFTPPALPRR